MIQTLQKFKDFSLGKACLGLMIVLLATGISSLTGCTSPNNDQSTHIQLSTWGSAQEITVLKELTQAFEQSHPGLKVDILHIPENYYQKLHILVAGDLTPDVVFTNSISFPIYASQGIFKDLRPFLAADAGISETQFYPQALKAFTWQSASGQSILAALPRDISNVVIFYNQDLFDKAHLPSPKANWTWEEFRETADQLTVDQNNDGDPDQFGFSFYSTPPLFWLPFVWSAGGDLFSPDLKQVLLNQPKSTNGLQFYADLRNKWHVAPKKVESGGITMSQLFLQQKVAMMVNGRWSVPVLREQAKFNWNVAPLPIGPSGKSRVGIDASGYAISAKSKHPKESFELIQFLLSEEALRKVTNSGLIIPSRPDVAESDSFLAPGQLPTHGRVFLDVIPDGVPTHTPARWNEIAEELGLALEPVWDGKQNAKTAMSEAKPKLDRLLEVSP